MNKPENNGQWDRAVEQRLIASAKGGDRSAVRELVELHKNRLFSFIWRMVRDYHDTEEICQDAFLKAFASLGTFSSEYRFSTWLFTIAYRVSLNRMRRRRPLSGSKLDLAVFPMESDAASVAESEDAGHLKETVWCAVDQLSPSQKATILLFYRYSQSCQDIARVLELPVATVKSHLHRGRLRLRELLERLSDTEIQEFRNRTGRAG